MKFPALIKKQFCKTPVDVMVIYSESLSEEGAPIVMYERHELFPDNNLFPRDDLYIGPLYCNYQASAKTIYNAKQKLVTVTGTLLFAGDLCPALAEISSGYVEMFGVRREIARGSKARNPDGTVNYTRLDVI